MATLKLTIFKAKVLKDGRHKIRIAVCHRHETSYIITRFVIDNLSQFKNGQVVKRPDAANINMKLRNMLNEYQEKLDSIKNIGMYTCSQLRQVLVGRGELSTTPTFQAVSNEYIQQLIKDGRENYATLLERNCRYFTEFSKGEFLLSDINPFVIENYSRFLKANKRVSETTIGMMMSRTRTIINRAIKQQLVKYDISPFAYYKVKTAPAREVDLTIENFTKVMNCSPCRRRLEVARDLFLLSFYLCGMNLVDLLAVDFRSAEQVVYIRKKSKNLKQSDQRIIIPIPERAKPILNKWVNRNTGRLDFGYKFTYPNFSRYLSRSLEILANEIQLSQKLVYYSARKSFAQYASELGIPDGIIDYCLGHSDKNKGVIRYYTKVKEKQAEIAVNRVIDYVLHPERYKEFLEMRADIMMMRI